ncbi:MAG: polysaccharide biosynthesis tyrosine autokinase [Verrucomicrobiota bacterium]
MALKGYVSLLRRWMWFLIIITVLAASLSFIVNILMKPVYQATTTLLINQAPNNSASPDYTSLLTSQSLAKTYKELLRKRPVLSKVIETLNLPLNEEQLAANTTVDIVRDTQLIVLSVEDTNRNRAVLTANAIAKEFSLQNQSLQASRYSTTKQSLQEELVQIQADIERTQASLDTLKATATSDQVAEQTRLQTVLTQYRASYADLLKSFEALRLAEAQSSSNVTVAEEAQGTKQIRPNTLSSTILAAFIGLLLALGIVFLVDYLDDSVKTTEQTEQLVKTSTLGIIPSTTNVTGKIVTLHQASSPSAEAYRILRANIEFSEVDKPIRTLAVTSSNAGEGKSTTIVNLAVAMAQTGSQVILVDTDLRRPTLHTYFQQSNVLGVTTVLLDQGSTAMEYLVPTSVNNLRLLASGPLPPNPAELLGTQRMVALIEELKTLSDIVLFDSSPLLPVVDPTLLARICDATLLVVKAGDTKAGSLKKAYAQLQQSGTRLLGVVLNQVSTKKHSAYYYYYYQSGYSSNTGSKKRSLLPWNRTASRTASRNKRSKHHTRTEPEGLNELPESHNYAADGNGELLKGNSASPFGQPNGQPNGFGRLDVTSGPSAGQVYHVKTNRVIVGRGTRVKKEPSESLPASADGEKLDTFGSTTTTLYDTVLVLDDADLDLDGEPPKSLPVPSDGEKLDTFGSTTTLYDTATISIADDKVSRRHIEITFGPHGVHICDLGSRNGTWLNGRKLKNKPVVLRDKAEIRLGYRTILVYHQGEDKFS